MFGSDHSTNGVPWDGRERRHDFEGGHDAGSWFQHKYQVFDKLNGLEKKVNDIEKSVDEIKFSFLKLQTKIMMVSGMSGVVSAGIITAVFTALADKFIK